MTYRAYIPILRVLGAEMDGALRCDSWTKNHMTPLFRIVRSRNDEAPEQYLGRAVHQIVKTWARQGEAFVEIEDQPNLDDTWINPHPVELIHTALQSNGVRSIPVIPTHADEPFRDASFSTAKRFNSNIGVRVYRDDLEVPEEIVSKVLDIARESSIRTTSIDLIIDVGFIRPDTLAVLREQASKFLDVVERELTLSSTTVVGSSVPSELKRVPQNTIRELLVSEQQLWRFVTRGRTMRVGAGDYSVVRADYVDRRGPFPHINAKLFYSIPGRMVVCRGCSRVKEPLDSQFTRLAKMLVGSNYFSGRNFSWGDLQLSRVAEGRRRVGDPSQMIAIATSHHLTQMAKRMVTASASQL